ncbi:unnamed protein product [Brassicogethes aeneus]|uniref:Uncharacterized protein n=1 Tax=Brassicogethes aeneus TaxID=1431903 RepID=A0A9P0AZ03_BRAAE|nr:unnamed protein product [Brassicogethes aeneus]
MSKKVKPTTNANLDIKTIVKEVISEFLNDDTFLQKIADKVNKEMQQKIGKLEQEIKHMQNKTNELKVEMNILRQNEKKNNVCIHGLEENPGEDIHNTIITFLKKNVNGNIEENEIENAYRIGKNKNKRRSIIVEFKSNKSKNSILQNKKLLKGKNVFITEDLTKENLEILKKCQEKFGLKNAWPINGKIYAIVKEKKLCIESLGKLEEISPEDHDIEEVEEQSEEEVEQE